MTIVVQTAAAAEPLTVAEVLLRCRIDQSNQELAPTAPTLALASPAAPGNVTAGAHRILATFATADGETEAGEVSSAVTVADNAVNGQLAVSGIPLGGSLVTARKLYMTAAGGSTYMLAATIANNTATTATINVADGSLGAGAPSTNTTSDQELISLIKSARQAAERELSRYLVTQTLDAYFDAFPGADCDYTILLPPLSTVSAVTYIDTSGAEQTLASDQYQVDAVSKPARIRPAYACSWPSTREQNNAVKVRFVAGYGAAAAVPDCVKQWMLLQIKQAYDNKSPTILHNTSEQSRNFIDGLLDSERVYGLP